MKETGLMFKAPLVRAILEGRKTQTRRVVKGVGHDNCIALRKPSKTKAGVFTHAMDAPKLGLCPCGKPGDRIYVRETFVQGYKADPETGAVRDYDEEGNDIPMTTWYRATDGGITWCDDDGWETNVPWKPAIHMPKALARIWLEVTGVRVERLHAITEADAVRDGGLHRLPATGRYVMNQGDQYFGLATHDSRELFREIWESTGGDWAADPWVWVVDFKILSTTGRPA